MEEIFSQYSWVIIPIIIWSIPWKGVALWKSARNKQSGWFVALLIINSLAILDILYIFVFSKMGIKEEEQQNMNLPVKINPNPLRKNNIV